MKRTRPCPLEALALLLAGLLSSCGSGSSQPASAASVLERARELSSRHRVAEALAVIEAHRAGRVEPSAPSADDLALQEKEASLLLTLSRPRDARVVLDRLVGAGRPSDSVLRLVAAASLDLGDGARALEAIDSMTPAARAEAAVERGKALVALGRAAEGAALLAAALVRDPWRDPAYLELGRALVGLGDVEGGRVFLERYREAGPFRRAENEALALEADGDDAGANHRRACAERDRGRLFEAMTLENRAIQLRTGIGDAYLELARLSLFLARPADAVSALERLPADPKVVELLAEARAAAAAQDGPLARARDLTAGDGLVESVPALLALARAHAEEGRLGDARKLVLFLSCIARRKPAPRRETARLFTAPADVFVRLWALRPILAAGGFAELLAAELRPLAIDSRRVLEALRGEE